MIPESNITGVDTELVRKVQADGGEEAQRLLYQRHVARVFRHCRSYGISPADAQDLVQEIFITVFDKIGDLRQLETFGAWLAAITRNRCFQYLKLRSRRAPLEQVLDDDLPAEDRRECEAALHEAKLAIVREAVAGVKNDRHRAAIELFYLEGLSCEEISKRQEMTVTNVTTQLSRFRARVQRELIRKILELDHD